MSPTNAAAPAAGPAAYARRLARLRMASFGLVTMLILQYVLGMIYNVYGTAPAPGQPVGVFSDPVLSLHVVLAALLLLSAVVLVIRSVAARHSLAIGMSALGLLAIAVAIVTGLAFTHDGSAATSIAMAIAFAAALACYVINLVGLRP